VPYKKSAKRYAARAKTSREAFNVLLYFLASLSLLEMANVADASPIPPNNETARLDRILNEVGFDSDQVTQVRRGEVVSDVQESTADREVATRIAMLVRKPLSEIRAFVTSKPKQPQFDPTILQSGFIQTVCGRDSKPDDEENLSKKMEKEFSELDLGREEGEAIKLYLEKPGELNLDEGELEQLKAAKREDLANWIRSMLVQRVKSYQKEGLKGIRPYVRGKGKSFSVGDELRHETEVSKLIKREVPAFHRHLLNYPKDRPESAEIEEGYSWVNYEVEGKPTYVLIHRIGAVADDGAYAFCERHFFVSRCHNCAQFIGGAFPAEDGTILVAVSRASTDKVTGFGGSMKKLVGSKMMQSKMSAVIEKYQAAQSNDEL
jgi:hypothetical protein